MKTYYATLTFGVLIATQASSKGEAERLAEQHPLVKKITSIPGVWYDDAYITGSAESLTCSRCGAEIQYYLTHYEDGLLCPNCANL